MSVIARLIATFSEDSEFATYTFRMITKGADIFECARTVGKIRNSEDWFRAWHEAGQQWEERAEAYVAKGSHASARDAFLNASFFYRAAEFFLLDEDPERKVAAYMKNTECFEKAGRFFDPPLRRVEVPYEGSTLPGFLYLPAQMKGRVPGVVIQGGADDCKEEHHFIGPAFMLERGLACITVDGPGRGEALRMKKLYSRPDYEKVISPVIDFLAAQPEIDPERIGLAGISMGGYYAPRGAAYHARVKACVLLSALYDVGEGLYDPFPPIRHHIRYLLGAKDLKEAREKLRAFTLKDCIKKITCPLLIIHGGEDVLMPVSEAHRIYNEATCPKELKIWEDGRHNCTDYQAQALPYAWDWLKDKLG